MDDEEDAAVESVCADGESGRRVDAWLAELQPDLSRSRVQGLIGAGKLTADGALVSHASDKTRAGVRYRLMLPPPASPTPLPEDLPIDVVYEDDSLIVVDKAAGMAMHPAPGSMTGTLVNALLAHCGASLSGIGGVARPGIVHRIDKDTTGLVVVAKNDVTHRDLAGQFAAHTVERAYYAVTRGAPHPRSATVENRLVRSADDRRKFVVVRDADSLAGKHAVTRYWMIESFGAVAGAPAGTPAAAFVECRLETGRTHQIRAHMAHIGSPLIGDPIYGKFRGLKAAGSGANHERAETAARDFARQALHAAVLGFRHPETGQVLRFESALPPDLNGLLEALRAL